MRSHSSFDPSWANCVTFWRDSPQLTYSRGMAVDPALLEILVCPVCRTPVRLTSDGTGLLCDTCHRRYPIQDDIPIMLVDEATIEAPADAAKAAGPAGD